jgi:carboxypeptidase family protein
MLARRAVAVVLSMGSLLPLGAAVGAQHPDSLASAAHASAVFRGRVIHVADGSPVDGADVWLVSLDKHALTDSTGAFRFDGLPAARELVQVRHVGLAIQRDTIVLASEHENVRTYGLSIQSATLDTVRTVAGAHKYVSPRLQQFEERRLSGQGGHFISDSTLRNNENRTLANLVDSRVPGAMLKPMVVPGKGYIMALVSTRKSCAGLAILHPQCSAPSCYVAIYLDGVLRFSSKLGLDPPDLSHDYNISDLAGVEYYAGGAASPAGMHSDDDGCGSLWLWTRERYSHAVMVSAGLSR